MPTLDKFTIKMEYLPGSPILFKIQSWEKMPGGSPIPTKHKGQHEKNTGLVWKNTKNKKTLKLNLSFMSKNTVNRSRRNCMIKRHPQFLGFDFANKLGCSLVNIFATRCLSAMDSSYPLTWSKSEDRAGVLKFVHFLKQQTQNQKTPKP